MNRRLALALMVTGGLGACAGSLGNAVSVGTPRPAQDAFGCVRQQVKEIGFTQESFDEQELRVTARKYDEQARRPDVQFRRLVDRLLIDIDPGRSDTTTITVEARTFVELTTHRGPTLEEEKASENARLAAQAILTRCAAKP